MIELVTRGRVALLALGMTSLAAAVAGRLYLLQVARADELQAQARRQHELLIEVEGRRGDIVDRYGRELAVSVETSSLFAHPGRVRDAGRAARLLAPVLGIPASRILERLRSDAPFVWLARRLDTAVAAAVRATGLPAGKEQQPFGFETESKRFYPAGSLAIHVIGYANIDQNGVEGIEHVYDRTLKGDRSTYLAVRDGRGGMVLQLIRPPGKQPDDIVLTLDLVLQHIVERELDRAMRETDARAGSAVLMDPRSGEVLALANRPTADPNQYGKASPEGRRNRAVVDLYEPGSTFKVVTAAAALDRATVSTEQVFDCEGGSIQIGGRRIGDRRRFGRLSVREILEESSNVGMIKVGRTLAPEVFYDYIRRFGFGQRTGIELPGERAGQLQKPSRWSALSPASLAIGHEIGVTAVQLASAVGAIANEGVLVPPRIVLATRDTSGRLTPASRGEPRRVLSRETARTLAGLLEGVVLRGTGKLAAVPGYRIAGKTGTAQKVIPGGGYSSSHYVASFAGFAPLRAPRLVGLVVLDSPSGGAHSGGLAAAPVFSRIMPEALAHLRVPPDEEPRLARGKRESPPVRNGRTKPTSAPPADSVATLPGQVPDLKGLSLRGAVAALAARRYRAVAKGSGVVVAQNPPAGTPFEEGSACTLTLARDTRIPR